MEQSSYQRAHAFIGQYLQTDLNDWAEFIAVSYYKNKAKRKEARRETLDSCARKWTLLKII